LPDTGPDRGRPAASGRGVARGAGAAAFVPGPALAHAPIEGIDGFYVGLLHPLSTVPQLLALVALSVLLACGWSARTHLWLYVAALALGIGLGQAGLAPSMPEDRIAPLSVALLALALAAATLAALAPKAARLPALALAAAGGGMIGLLSTPDPGPLRATLITLAGSFTGAGLAVLYGSAGLGWLRERYPAAWMDIGQRVAAAWIAAVSALMLALAFAPQPPPA
jgi:hypothetical protein